MILSRFCHAGVVCYPQKGSSKLQAGTSPRDGVPTGAELENHWEGDDSQATSADKTGTGGRQHYEGADERDIGGKHCSLSNATQDVNRP